MERGDIRRFNTSAHANSRFSDKLFIVIRVYRSANGVGTIDLMMDGEIEKGWLLSYVQDNSRPEW